MKAKIRLSWIITAGATALMLAGCSTKSTKTIYRAEALDASAWSQSEWISAADAQVARKNDDDRSADGASWFVSTIKNEGKVASAKWMTTGLGVFEIYVNGQPVGEEILKPGFTHYAKTKRSFTYDVTAAFNTKTGAANILAAQVTPGWWADKIITPGGMENVIGKKVAFRGVLEIIYSDGVKKLYGTDTENWKAGVAGPVKHASIFDGEDFDARELPGYETPGKLSVPEVNKEFNGEILPSDGAEIYLREDIALSPVKAYIWEGVTGDTEEDYGKVVIKKEFVPGEQMVVKPGETLVIDFGQNAAAVPRFVFKAKGGTVLNCLPSELLNDGNGAKSRGMDGPEGSCHRRNLRVSDNCIRLLYTFADTKGFAEFIPLRTFFGYRLLSITATDEVTIKSIESVPVTSIAKDLETGTITTGNDLVNKLISNTVWGQRSNYLSVPTDCPQRNERLGWMADTQVFTETGTFFANTDGFFHKWTRDVRDSQSEAGGFPGVSPIAQYGNDMMRLGWADAGIIVPWTVWKQFGDNSIVDENWDAMDKFMNYVNDTKYDHATHASENGNYQWADWLSYEPLESCSGRMNMKDKSGKTVRRPEAIVYWNYLSASYWAIDAGMMADMAAGTGRDAGRYNAMAEDARNYMRETFLNPDGTFKTSILNTMQTPALFALKNNLVDGKAKEDMIARLRQNFKDHDDCLQTGFLGTSILMATLTENGMADIAYTLLFQRKNPSWLYSVDNGATTIWERWNSY
ncbi:MAG: family 78 glycoside hydrolase catalytic domain, partial [Bacteroidales bacterium]|nr:family 78 glycoside hydrolase catalytic domain [Bacteroidales bacterium]